MTSGQERLDAFTDAVPFKPIVDATLPLSIGLFTSHHHWAEPAEPTKTGNET
ncbi:MAG: hypothetical protein JNL35_05490 [Sphingopyxis sp.]|nr:hypothetical protein [Sphingopyxis sp.]